MPSIYQTKLSRISLFCVAIALLGLSACATKKGIIVESEKPAVIYDAKPVNILYGKASYYYGRWIGRLTANGETYRASDVTAAHKTLPFNTMVRVTNLKNGKSVIVRINNRGPYVKGRILDMSLVAAQRLEMTNAGVVPVKAEILKRIETAPKLSPAQITKGKKSAEKAIEKRTAEIEAKKPPTKTSSQKPTAVEKSKAVTQKPASELSSPQKSFFSRLFSHKAHATPSASTQPKLSSTPPAPESTPKPTPKTTPPKKSPPTSQAKKK